VVLGGGGCGADIDTSHAEGGEAGAEDVQHALPCDGVDSIDVDTATMHDVVLHSRAMMQQRFDSSALYILFTSSLQSDGTIEPEESTDADPARGRWLLHYAVDESTDVAFEYAPTLECPGSTISSTLPAKLNRGIEIEQVPDSPWLAEAYASDPTCVGFRGRAELEVVWVGGEPGTWAIISHFEGEIGRTSFGVDIATDGTVTVGTCIPG
jgi:hypothetical protein